MHNWTAVIATRNRRAGLARTLRAIPAGVEVIVVDNGSSDGTAAMVRFERPEAQVLRLARNLGPVAKQRAVERASGSLVMALDDDAWAPAASWRAAASKFAASGGLGCLGLGVRLPDGRWECGALRRVFVGAAVAYRREALLDCGGYDPRFFMQAEEYDIAFRMTAAGWGCEVDHAIPAIHDKSDQGRVGRRTLRLDARNNLVLARKFLPGGWSRGYASDWRSRYLALGRMQGGVRDAMAGVAEARRSARFGASRPLSEEAFEDHFGLRRIAAEIHRLRASGVRRVVFGTLGKNALAYWAGARAVGIDVVAIADDRFAQRGGVRSYRGAPVLATEGAVRMRFDAVVVANSAPIFAAQAAERWRRRVSVPVLAPDAADLESIESSSAAARADAA